MEQDKVEQVPSAEDVLAPPSQRTIVLRRLAGPLLSVGMLCLALWALHLLAREVNYHQVRTYVQSISRMRLLLAALFTLLGYGVMTLYDRFALASIGRRLSWQRVTLISFISYAFSNAVGMSLLVSGSIRYRFYIQNGLSTGEVARVVLFCTISFWLGLLALTGVTLLLVPLPPGLPLAEFSRPLGWNQQRTGIYGNCTDPGTLACTGAIQLLPLAPGVNAPGVIVSESRTKLAFDNHDLELLFLVHEKQQQPHQLPKNRRRRANQRKKRRKQKLQKKRKKTNRKRLKKT